MPWLNVKLGPPFSAKERPAKELEVTDMRVGAHDLPFSKTER